MNQKLYQRRSKMLNYIAVGSALPSVVQAISEEFGCSKDTAYRDYQNMNRWAKGFQQDKHLIWILRAKLDFLSRQIIDAMLHAKKASDKMEAAKTAMDIIKEQIKLAQILGLIEPTPLNVKETLTPTLTFETNPEIMATYRRSAEKQKAEKDASEKAAD
jgi:hypothetical protein